MRPSRAKGIIGAGAVVLACACGRTPSSSIPDAAAAPAASIAPLPRASAEPPVPSAPAVARSDVPLGLPLRGKAFVAWGGDTLVANKHLLQPSQRRAADLVVKVDDGERTFRGDGSKNADYAVYGRDVLAVADGTVLTVIDGVPENEPGHANPYVATGNMIILQHGPALYSAYGHLRAGKTRVKVGDVVHRGAVLGACGNSGSSSEPHLHFQLQDGPRIEASWGIEPVLGDVRVTRDGLVTSPAIYAFHRGDFVEALPATTPRVDVASR